MKVTYQGEAGATAKWRFTSSLTQSRASSLQRLP